VESSCEFGIELSGSMKCWETIEWPLGSAQLHIVSYVTTADPLCGVVVRVPGCRTRAPGSIPGASRFSEK
jgi:hypothetical protein